MKQHTGMPDSGRPAPASANPPQGRRVWTVIMCIMMLFVPLVTYSYPSALPNNSPVTLAHLSPRSTLAARHRGGQVDSTVRGHSGNGMRGGLGGHQDGAAKDDGAEGRRSVVSATTGGHTPSTGGGDGSAVISTSSTRGGGGEVMHARGSNHGSIAGLDRPAIIPVDVAVAESNFAALGYVRRDAATKPKDSPTTHYAERDFALSLFDYPVQDPPQPFVSTYGKYECGVRVTNFCLSRGQPHYFSTNPGQMFSSTGASMTCNEGGKKRGFHMVMHAVQTDGKNVKTVEGGMGRAAVTVASATAGDSSGNVSTSTASASSRFAFFPGKALVVANCWELYGYHLFLCLTATYVNMIKQGLGPLLRAGRVHVALKKAGSWTKTYVGSPASWRDPHREISQEVINAQSPAGRGSTQASAAIYTDSAYWPLLGLLTKNPSDVFPERENLFPGNRMRCYRLGLLGAPLITDIPPPEAQEAMSELKRVIGLNVRQRQCKKYNVVIVNRRELFRILNLDHVVAEVKSVFGSALQSVDVAVLETMTLLEQASLAHSADVIMGIHGNGLSWSALMEPGGAVMEYWPSAPFNSNYVGFAERANLMYVGMAGGATCPRRCSVPFDLNLLKDKLSGVLAALNDVACKGNPPNYMGGWYAYKAKKEEKRKKKAGG